MIPPPAMTTSALSMPEQAPELEDQLQSRQGCDVSVVVGRRHLYEVQADQLRACRGDAQEVERLPCGEPSRRWDLSSWREGRVEGVDVERNVEALTVERIGDHARRAAVAGKLRCRHQQHAPGANELELFRVVVASARDDHARRADARDLQRAAHRTAASPAAAAGEVAQVGVCIDPQHGQIGVAPSLCGKCRDRGAVIAAQHRQQSRGRDLRKLVGNPRPSRLDLRSYVEVAEIVHLETLERAAVFSDRWHDRRERADSRRGEGCSLSIHGRAVVRNPGHDNFCRFERAAGKAGPGHQSGEIDFIHRLFISGTLRMRRPPNNSQMKNTVNMTGYPPGRPSNFGPALNGSSRKPPMNRAMMPAPAVAMFVKPMNNPASPPGITSCMKAQSTAKNRP